MDASVQVMINDTTLAQRCRQGGVHPINLPAHKAEGVRQTIEGVGCRLLYLPPYTPDFNPIEKAFAKLKAILRAKAERTVDALWDAVGEVVTLFEPQECANYFKSCGYDPE